MDVRSRWAEKRDDSSICELIRNELGYPDLDMAGIEGLGYENRSHTFTKHLS